MKEILPGIWSWQWFSEEKGYFFNGLLIKQGGKAVLIDPVFTEESFEKFLPVEAIYLTNKDHERMAYEIRKKHGIPIWIHELDREFLKEKPDQVYKEGERLACGLKVVHLQNQKSPGESAFYMEERKILIVGDALIGHPAGKLGMLPAVKFQDARKAEAGLRRLFSLSFETLLVGDGQCVMKNAGQALEAFFDGLS